MRRKAPDLSKPKAARAERQFYAEGEYAESIVRNALGDSKGSIAALRRALAAMPTYAPAIFSMGSVDYQAGRMAEGRKLFQSLVSLPKNALPKNTTDICQIIDGAGTFLTRMGAYEDGMALYRKAVEKYPDVALLFEGLGYCASNAGLHEEAVFANERAVGLEPENQKLVNDLGWTLFQAGHLMRAKETLERAVSLDPADELAGENLRFCMGRSKGGELAKSGTDKRPAVVRVRSVERAEAIVALCNQHEWQVIVGVEEGEPEDVSDVEWLLGKVGGAAGNG